MNLNIYLHRNVKAQCVVKSVSILCVLAMMIMPSLSVTARAAVLNGSSQDQSDIASIEHDLAEENSPEMDDSQKLYLPIIVKQIDITSLPAFKEIVADRSETLEDDITQDMFINYLKSQQTIPQTYVEMKTSYCAFIKEHDIPDTGASDGKGHINNAKFCETSGP